MLVLTKKNVEGKGGTMLVLCIDTGIKNLAYTIIKTGSCHSTVEDDKDESEGKHCIQECGVIDLSPTVSCAKLTTIHAHKLCALLFESYFHAEFLKPIDMVYIESFSTRARKIMLVLNHLIFMRMQMADKKTSFVPPSRKYACSPLNAARMNYRQRKLFSVELARDILKKHFVVNSDKILDSVTKKDDLSDCVLLFFSTQI